MPRSDRMTGAAMHSLFLLLVVVVGAAAAISVVAAAAADVDSFSYPAFDATTTQDFVASTNTSILTPASLLFEHDALMAEFNRSEGFLLLSRSVDVWRAGPGGVPALETSFNTSFALTGAAPVAFVVLRYGYQIFSGTGGLRGFANYSASDAKYGATPRNASGSLASVEAGPVRSYGPDSPVSTIQDILVDVRGWNLTVDRFDSSGGDGWKKGTSWWVTLLGSVAAMA